MNLRFRFLIVSLFVLTGCQNFSKASFSTYIKQNEYVDQSSMISVEAFNERWGKKAISMEKTYFFVEKLEEFVHESAKIYFLTLISHDDAYTDMIFFASAVYSDWEISINNEILILTNSMDVIHSLGIRFSVCLGDAVF